MADPLRVLLVTTWDTPCGIAEHSALLKQAVEGADSGITVEPFPHLHPVALLGALPANAQRTVGVVHLNYHAALHSQWTPAEIRILQETGYKVLVTYHDTGVPNSQQAKDVCAAADAFVVHEPYDDLEGHGHYWRQGVPDWQPPTLFDHRGVTGPRPIVGTVGFPFPWKNYDLLCEASAQAGWATVLIAPKATPEQIAGWRARQPHLIVYDQFVRRETVVSLLSGCDATVFVYANANTGTSGAIRQGIAARKPVLASAYPINRQVRDLSANGAIRWLSALDVDTVALNLSLVPIQRVDPGIVALAHRDSWTGLGTKYAQLYRSLLEA